MLRILLNLEVLKVCFSNVLFTYARLYTLIRSDKVIECSYQSHTSIYPMAALIMLLFKGWPTSSLAFTLTTIFDGFKIRIISYFEFNRWILINKKIKFFTVFFICCQRSNFEVILIIIYIQANYQSLNFILHLHYIYLHKSLHSKRSI